MQRFRPGLTDVGLDFTADSKLEFLLVYEWGGLSTIKALLAVFFRLNHKYNYKYNAYLGNKISKSLLLVL